MRRILHVAIALMMLSSAATAQTDLSGILEATRAAAAEKDAGTAAALGGIASGMRVQQASVISSLSDVASAMRTSQSADAGSRASAFYGGDVSYSTYGIDARSSIAGKSPGVASNPFLMGTYDPSVTYAAPGGTRYIDLGGSGHYRPVSGRVTSGYGYRPSFGRMHHGVDLSLNTGDTVRAAFDGKVVLVADNPKGYGRYVKVKHADGMETLYGHLSMPLVIHGQQLRAGQPLGLGGATGNATGPHLHFETRVNGIAVDPDHYFDFSRPGNASARKGGASPLRDDGARYTPPRTKKEKKNKANERPAGELKGSARRLRTETVASASGNGKEARTASYKVRRGDTLQKIARDHGMSVGEICRLNRMSPYTPMYTGKVIRLK